MGRKGWRAAPGRPARIARGGGRGTVAPRARIGPSGKGGTAILAHGCPRVAAAPPQ